MSHPTINTLTELGSLVFESAIVAMGLPEALSRVLLTDRLSLFGLKPSELTIELLGSLMPQFDETLRLCMPAQEAKAAMSRLAAFIIDWEAPTESPTLERASSQSDDFDFQID